MGLVLAQAAQEAVRVLVRVALQAEQQEATRQRRTMDLAAEVVDQVLRPEATALMALSHSATPQVRRRLQQILR